MSSELRRAIAVEAARLLLRRKESNHAAARKRAARWLSRRRVHREDMPSRREIDDQFDVLAGLESAEQLEERLRELQWLALEVGELLAPFEPTFHGPVVDGPVTPGIEIGIAIRTDSWEPVDRILGESDAVRRLDRRDDDLRRFQYRLEPFVVSRGEVVDGVDRETLTRLAEPVVFDDSAELEEDAEADEAFDYEHLRHLLARLDGVRLPTDRHPEGDALYHALQTFELGRAARPWDEEFLAACLVHDAGLAVEPRLGIAATLEALDGLVTARTLSLVAGLPRMERALKAGRLPKSLRGTPEAEDLGLLARCDRDGRVPGQDTCSLDEAIDYLEQLEESWDDG